MHNRFSPWALLLVALALPFAGCSNPLVDTLSISPSTASLTVNQTLQLTAIGTVGHGSGHPSTTQDDTAQAKWTSSNPAVASVSNTTPGLVTALTSGTTTITASMNGYTGLISATAAVTVAGGTTGIGTIGGITSLSVIPSSQSVAIPGDTTQFLAIGTSSTGATTDLTTAVTWKSASQQIATIGATTGFATAVSQGSDAIIAEYTNPSGGSTVTGTGTFSVSAGLAEQFTAVTIVPGSESLAAGGSANLTALATQGGTGLQQDVTNLPNTTWLSSDLTHVTVTSGLTAGNGVVTDAGVGPSTITVEVQNQDKSIVSGTAASYRDKYDSGLAHSFAHRHSRRDRGGRLPVDRTIPCDRDVRDASLRPGCDQRSMHPLDLNLAGGVSRQQQFRRRHQQHRLELRYGKYRGKSRGQRRDRYCLCEWTGHHRCGSNERR